MANCALEFGMSLRIARHNCLNSHSDNSIEVNITLQVVNVRCLMKAMGIFVGNNGELYVAF